MATAPSGQSLLYKPTLNTPSEQSLAASQMRQRFSPSVEIGNYGDASPLEQHQIYQSLASETDVSGRLKAAKKEWQLRKEEKGSGRLGLENQGLANIDINDPTARKEKWGTNLGSMKSLMSSLRKRASDEKNYPSGVGQMGKQMAMEAAAAPVGMATSELLQQSWYNLIDSFGLTILYINFHVVCRYVFGEKFFCKLGHEWTGGKKGVSKSAGKTSIFGFAADALGLGEVAVLIIVDLIVAFLIFIQILPIIIIVWMVLNPTEAAQLFGFGGLWEAVKAYFSL